MKKFSTAAALHVLLALAASIGSIGVVQTASAEPAARMPSSARCEFLPNAPDQHKVVRGDTLWGISGQFLKSPWCWPQVWGMNRAQIHNPHWIYPGQIVYFDRAAGRLRLGSPKGDGFDGAGGTEKLSPQVRSNGLGNDAISTIPAGLIAPFLSQPLIIEDGQMDNAPHIVAAAEGRVNLGRGDKAYVQGDLGDGTSFQVFRPGEAINDPVTKKVIAHEAKYLGTLKLVRPAQTSDEASTFTVVDAKEEMGIGDLLVASPLAPVLNYVPHPPATDTQARIASIYGGVENAGQNQIVTINQGSADNIDVGTVLQLYRTGELVADPISKRTIKLPDEQYGTLFIFRVFNHISYGLIMEVRDTVDVGDIARSPE